MCSDHLSQICSDLNKSFESNPFEMRNSILKNPWDSPFMQFWLKGFTSEAFELLETIGTWLHCSLECSPKLALLISKKRKSYDTWKWKYRRESKKFSRSSRKSNLKNFWQPHFKRIWFETFTSNRCRSVRDGRNTLFLAFRMMP